MELVLLVLAVAAVAAVMDMMEDLVQLDKEIHLEVFKQLVHH